MKGDTTIETINTTEKSTLWNREFITVLIIGLFLNIGIFMMNTLVPKYLDFLGEPPAVIGFVTSVFFIAALGIKPIAGPAIDFFVKEKLLRWMLILLILTFVGYGFTTTVAAIVIVRIIHGAAAATAFPLSMAMVSAALPRDKMTFGIGIFTLTQTASMAIGPSVGLWMIDRIGYQYAFVAVAGTMLVSLILTLWVRSAPPENNARLPENKTRFKITLDSMFVVSLWVPVLMMMMNAFGAAGINNFLVLYGELRGVANISLYFTANAIAVVFARLLCGKLADKYGADKLMIPGLILFIFTFALIGASKTQLMFIIAGVVAAFGSGICSPLLMTMCMQLVPKSKFGAASNSNMLGADAGLLIGGSLAGLVITWFHRSSGSLVEGYSSMYYFMIIPSVASLIIFLICRKNLMKRLRSAPQD